MDLQALDLLAMAARVVSSVGTTTSVRSSSGTPVAQRQPGQDRRRQGRR